MNLAGRSLFSVLRRRYSSFPGIPKTLEECYSLFYLDDACSHAELRAAYTTTVKRYSDSIYNVKEIDKAYYRILQDLKEKRPDVLKDGEKQLGSIGKMSTVYSGHFTRGGAGSVDAMVEGMVSINIDEQELKNLPGVGKPLKKNPYENPYLDPVSSKLNEIMIKQNIGTEWMEMKKEMTFQLNNAKVVLTEYRKKLEQRSISKKEWQEAIKDFHERIVKVNKIVHDYNIVVPVLRMQMMEYRPDRLIEKLEIEWEEQKQKWKQ